MNIEESVEYLKNCLNDEYNFKNATRKKDKEAIETLLTAYEKEIEELEKNRKVSQNFAKIVATDYISKDKIKAKIEEYKKQQKEEPDAYLCIKVLQSLLKED